MLVVALVTLLGLVIGSFLTVVIWRLPRGESVVSPPSYCPDCCAAITARDSVPVLSWLLLRGRCRDCGGTISVRYPAVELLTAVLFGATAVRFGLSWELPAFLYLGAVGVALSFIDLDTKRLPNALTLPSYPILAILLLLPAALEPAWGDFLRALLGGAALFAFYLLTALINPAGMGMGDVKLAGVLGMALGWLGWGTLVLGGFLGLLYGAVAGIAMILTRRAGRRSEIPFGPFMVAGALTAILVGAPIVTWYGGMLSA